jgi:hypothetical protein
METVNPSTQTQYTGPHPYSIDYSKIEHFNNFYKPKRIIIDSLSGYANCAIPMWASFSRVIQMKSLYETENNIAYQSLFGLSQYVSMYLVYKLGKKAIDTFKDISQFPQHSQFPFIDKLLRDNLPKRYLGKRFIMYDVPSLNIFNL